MTVRWKASAEWSTVYPSGITLVDYLFNAVSDGRERGITMDGNITLRWDIRVEADGRATRLADLPHFVRNELATLIVKQGKWEGELAF